MIVMNPVKGPDRQKQNRVKIRAALYGWILLFLLFWIPAAAVVTANNFLFIIFVMIAGLALVSHRMAKNNLQSCELSRRFPDEIYAETTFPLQYILKSHGSRPAFALEYLEKAPLGSPDSPMGFYRVDPRETAYVTKFFSIPTRGDKLIEPGTLSSTFPFGLAAYSTSCGPFESIIVFPHVEPVEAEIPPEVGKLGSGMERTDPFGTIPYNFREYMPGDPYKHIDWKKTARTGELITRILSDYGRPEICINLPQGASERAISRAASLVVHFANRGVPVSLRGPGIFTKAGSGREFTRELLTILARWDNSPAETPDIQPHRQTTVEIDASGEFVWKYPGGMDEEPAQRVETRS